MQSSEAKGTHGVTAGKEKSAGFRFSLLLVMFIHSSTAYYKTQLHPMVMEGSSKLQIWKSVANMAELQGTKTPHSYSFQLGRGNACVPLQNEKQSSMLFLQAKRAGRTFYPLGLALLPH